jgi:hypothetical protein
MKSVEKNQEQKTFEELMKEWDEDEIWGKYMEEHLKEEEECRRKRVKIKKKKH